MNIEIKSFEMKYLNDLLKCWNENLIYDLLNEDKFIKSVLLDENFAPNLLKIALYNDQFAGFIFAIKRKIPYLERGLEPHRGWINIIAIHPSYRRQGIGQLLVQSVEKEFMTLGVKEITLCAYSPNYFTPGIDIRYKDAISFFEKQDYKFVDNAVSMQRDLWDFKISESAIKKINQLKLEGIRIIPYQKQYMLQLLDFLLEQFGSGWKRNALIAMQNNEAEKTILLVINNNDNILGFCMRKIDGNDARFGPFGVHNVLRSKGIGGVLFETMMFDMKSRGIPYLYFLWTGGSAQRFYERHHLKVYREYRLYRKALVNEI